MFHSFNSRRPGEDALSPAERKRTRDRRAQQKVREKRSAYIQRLEQQLALCTEQHTHDCADSTDETIRCLDFQNSQLHAALQEMTELAESAYRTVSQMKTLVAEAIASSSITFAALNNLNVPGTTPDTTPDRQSQHRISDLLCATIDAAPIRQVSSDNSQVPGQAGTMSTSTTDICPHDFDFDSNYYLSQKFHRDVENMGLRQASARHQISPARSCDWNNNNNNNNNSAKGFETAKAPWELRPESAPYHPSSIELAPWIFFPKAVAAAPALPKPLDLMFGSHDNFLANEIHTVVRKFFVSEPERLANGWLLYVFSKWRMCPSKESYELLPAFIRPLPDQVKQNNELHFDMIYWPKIRQNLMQIWKESPSFNYRVFYEALSCCAKVRWPWGKEILRKTEQGAYEIDPEFFKTFTSLEGWGLTSEFIEAYMPLFKGLDIDTILYRLA